MIGEAVLVAGLFAVIAFLISVALKDSLDSKRDVEPDDGDYNPEGHPRV